MKGVVLTSADFLAHQLPQHVSAAPSDTLSSSSGISVDGMCVCARVCVCSGVCVFCMCLCCMLGSDKVPD